MKKKHLNIWTLLLSIGVIALIYSCVKNISNKEESTLTTSTINLEEGVVLQIEFEAEETSYDHIVGNVNTNSSIDIIDQIPSIERYKSVTKIMNDGYFETVVEYIEPKNTFKGIISESPQDPSWDKNIATKFVYTPHKVVMYNKFGNLIDESETDMPDYKWLLEEAKKGYYSDMDLVNLVHPLSLDASIYFKKEHIDFEKQDGAEIIKQNIEGYDVVLFKKPLLSPFNKKRYGLENYKHITYDEIINSANSVGINSRQKNSRENENPDEQNNLNLKEIEENIKQYHDGFALDNKEEVIVIDENDKTIKSRLTVEHEQLVSNTYYQANENNMIEIQESEVYYIDPVTNTGKIGIVQTQYEDVKIGNNLNN